MGYKDTAKKAVGKIGGNLNWENAARGLTGIIQSMTKLEKQKQEVMGKMLDDTQKREQDWFYAKKKLDYQQELKTKSKEADPYVDIQRGSLELRQRQEAKKTETSRLEHSNFAQLIKATDTENLGEFLQMAFKKDKSLMSKIDIEHPYVVKAVAEKWASKEAIKGESILGLAKSMVTNARQRFEEWVSKDKFAGEKDEVDMSEVDMNKVRGLTDSIKTQEDMDEFESGISTMIKQGNWNVSEMNLVRKSVQRRGIQ